MELEIDARSLEHKLSQPGAPLVLDVRTPAETQAGGVIAGALLIPMDQLPSRLGELPDGREVVAVCAHGMRSYNVAMWLQAQGRKALSLQGGMVQWRALGLPVAR